MTPGTPEIRHCPHCEKLVAQRTLNSGNTFGATFWLDNKCEAPMLPSYPDLGRCPHCGVLMRHGTARKAKSPGYALPEGADWLQEPNEIDWLESLQNAMWNGDEEELDARIAAWHAANDSVRHSEAKPQFSALALQNLRDLSELMRAASEEPYLLVLRAEIARETGDFTTSLALLEEADTQFDEVTAQIAALAHAHDTSIKQRIT